jgi:hypothetical protein
MTLASALAAVLLVSGSVTSGLVALTHYPNF